MEIDKVFSNDVDGVADNLFSAVKNSVSEIKAMQQRKAAENVQLVIQALKKIESDLQDKFDGVTTVIEKRVSTIKDGRDGINGRDGRDGKEGRPGKDGLPGRPGKDGMPGRDGVDGQDGVSVTDARIDFDGSLIIGLSTGREINVGEVVAPDLAERIKVITNGGGTSQSVLDTLASLQAQINALDGFLDYKGTWNASTNTPTLVSSTGTKGDYYVVSVAGSTNLNGETTWGVGDWVVFNNSVWQKVDGGSTGNFTTAAIATSLNLAYGTASTALALDASKNVVSVTNTGTGNNVLAGSPTLTGTVNAAAVTMSSDLTLSGGTANGVTYLNGSKVLTTGSALTFDGTNLGVNVTPIANQGRIQANGSGQSWFKFYDSSAGWNFGTFYKANGTSALAYLGGGGGSAIAGGTVDDFVVRAEGNMLFAISTAEQMRLTSTGLGIGTSSPATKLQVYGTAVATQISIDGTGRYKYFEAYASGTRRFYSGWDETSLAANLFTDGAHPITFGTNGSERARIDSSGNLGVGTTSPAQRLEIAAASPRVRITDTDGGYAQIEADNGNLFLVSDNGNTVANSNLTFGVDGTERARIDSSGNLLVGKTSPSTSTVGAELQPNASAGYIAGFTSDGQRAVIANRLTSDGDLYSMRRSGTEVGTISVTTTATAYNTSSDYRLKDNQQPLTGSGAFIDALQPKTWSWKADGSKGVGFIAHEAQVVSPSSVVGEKDAVDEDGKPIMQAMEYGSAEFIANIIAELQSLRKRVAQLEGK